MRRARALAFAAAFALAACGGDAERTAEIEPHERRLGAEQHEPLLAQFGGAYRGPEGAYLDRIGEEVAAAAGLAEECTFTLVNTDVVNAFAVPGCYIYVTRGLMALMGSEAELASVLAHEVGHIVADHSERQQQRSLLRQLGVIAVGWATESEFLMGLAGGAAELFTLRYSRTHEHEADELAIRYLVEAGYDPHAAAGMLEALARNERFQRAGGADMHALPEWARTHPLTENRIERVRAAAQATGVAPDELPEGEAAFLDELDGLLYGDDPEQGFVRGRRFLHPELRVAFEVPQGFALTNTPRAVLIEGPEGLGGEFGAGPEPRDGLEGYAARLLGEAFAGHARVGEAARTRIGGIPALIVPASVATEQGAADVAAAIYAGGGGTFFHFLLVSPPGRPMPAAADALLASFRRLSPAEAAALRPRTIEIVELDAPLAPAALAARMAGERPLERLLMLNGLERGETLAAGTRIKLVREGG